MLKGWTAGRRWRLGARLWPLPATRRYLAPTGLETRRRLAKWAVISPLIGLIAGIGAIVFYSANRR